MYLLATIVAALIVPRLIHYLLKSKAPLKPELARQRGDKVMSIGLIVYAIFLIYNHATSIHFLDDLQCNVNSPSYVLRNAYRDYMLRVHPEWSETSTDNVYATNTAKLYNRLRSVEERSLYVTHGHQAYTQCSWCTESSDYLIFRVPTILALYAIASVMLGLASSIRRKSHWRSLGFYFLIICFCVDGFVFGTLYSHESYWIDVGYTYQAHEKMRSAIQVIFVLLVLAINKKDIRSETDSLKAILSTLNDISGAR